MDTERWISQKPYVFSRISFFLQMRNICNASVSRPSGHFRSSRLMRRPVWGSDLETTRFVTLPAVLFYPFTEIHNGAREKQFVRICICERYRAQSCVICDNLFFFWCFTSHDNPSCWAPRSVCTRRKRSRPPPSCPSAKRYEFRKWWPNLSRVAWERNQPDSFLGPNGALREERWKLVTGGDRVENKNERRIGLITPPGLHHYVIEVVSKAIF